MSQNQKSRNQVIGRLQIFLYLAIISLLSSAYSLAFLTCDARSVPPCGVISSNPAHDASRTAADITIYILFIVIVFCGAQLLDFQSFNSNACVLWGAGMWLKILSVKGVGARDVLKCNSNSSSQSPHCRVRSAVEART